MHAVAYLHYLQDAKIDGKITSAIYWQNDVPVVKFTNLDVPCPSSPGRVTPTVLEWTVRGHSLSEVCQGAYCEFSAFDNPGNTGACPLGLLPSSPDVPPVGSGFPPQAPPPPPAASLPPINWPQPGKRSPPPHPQVANAPIVQQPPSPPPMVLSDPPAPPPPQLPVEPTSSPPPPFPPPPPPPFPPPSPPPLPPPSPPPPLPPSPASATPAPPSPRPSYPTRKPPPPLAPFVPSPPEPPAPLATGPGCTPTDVCASNNNVNHANPCNKDCTTYVACFGLGGLGIVQFCPSPLVFNPEIA
eukprot:353797-Chlamydomonas_euryale.AAC.4